MGDMGLRLDQIIHELREVLCTLGVRIQAIVGGVMLLCSGPRLLYYLLACKYLILQVLSEIPPGGMDDFINSLGALRVERVLQVMKQGKTLLLGGPRVVGLLILVNLNSCRVLGRVQ